MHKRILIFSTDDHLYPAGGAEQAMGNITERMPDVEFDLICAKLRKGVKAFEQVKNVNIYRMGFGVPKLDGIILALFGQYCAAKLIRANRYDLVWSIMASYGAFAAVRVKKKYKLPLLLTLQEGDSFEHIYARVKYVRRSFNAIFKSADAIQAISNYLLSWGKEMGYEGTLGKVIPNGVALDVYAEQYPSSTIKTTRASFGFKDDAVVLITSSRLERKNGVGDVIEALPYLPEHVCFVVCGSGSLETKLRARVRELHIDHRIKWMGFVDPKTLPLLLKASDIFIRPSLTEGLGNAFLEAMAARVLTVGTRAGGIPDFLTDGETGFFVDIASPQSIANTVKRILLLDESTKLRIRDRAERMVHERYDWRLITTAMRELFERLAVRKPALILDGNLKSTLAVVRSLGEKGIVLSVGAERKTAMALHSRYAESVFTYPSPLTHEIEFVDSVQKEAARLGDKPVVFAQSDATFLALYRHRAKLADVTTLMFPHEEAMEMAFNKAATYSLARVSNVPTISTVTPATEDEFSRLSKTLTYPVVVKPRRSASWRDGVGAFGSAEFAMSAEDLRIKHDTMWKRFGEQPLIQEVVMGEEYGVEMVAQKGEPCALAVHHRLRSFSPRGGASVLKEIESPGSLRDMLLTYAKKLVHELRWDGPIMVEFKVDSDTRTPKLMEINGRFWGSLPLSVTAGVDMPYLYYLLATGAAPKGEIPVAKEGTTSRHFMGDGLNLLRVLFAHDPMRPLLYPRRWKAVKDFFKVPRGTRGDVWSWRDPKPAFFEIVDMIKKYLWK